MKPALVALCLATAGCDLAYPEVVIANQTAEHVQIRGPSFSGCAWSAVLAFGDATSVGRCLPGADRIHFEKLDATAYCAEQAEDATETDPGLVSAEPMWFSYQTRSAREAEYGDFYVFEVRLDDMEQDFSVPGPYGH